MHITCPRCKRHIRIRKARKIICKCGNEFDVKKYFALNDMYLVDTNIILYAINNEPHRGRACQQLLAMHNEKLGVVKQCLDEIGHKVPYDLKIYKVKKMSDEVKELKSTTEKQPSAVDLMLIQVAIDNPEIKGIISFDKDFLHVAAKGMVQRKGGSFWVGNAEEFLGRSSKEQKWKRK